MRLAGKTAIVMGGGQQPGETIGNGRAVALAFAREGARVLVVDIDLALAQQTQTMITEAGGTALSAQADVIRLKDCERVARMCTDAWGSIDILHNNVGIATGDADAVDLEEQNWDRILDVNLKGMFLACKAVLPQMRKQRSGAIINISSIGALMACERVLAYKVTKTGINGMTHSIAIANAEFGIRCNSILPGLIETPMSRATSTGLGYSRQHYDERRRALVPLKHELGSAWDVAHAAVFLASEEARYITGVNLPVDGGVTLLVGHLS